MSPLARNTSPIENNSAWIGAVLVVSSLLVVVLMAHHPAFTVHDTRRAIAEIARTAALGKGVHAGLIVLMAVQAFAFADAAHVSSPCSAPSSRSARRSPSSLARCTSKCRV